MDMTKIGAVLLLCLLLIYCILENQTTVRRLRKEKDKPYAPLRGRVKR